MRRTLALAGLAVALGFGAPAMAQAAVTLPASVALQGDATLHLAGGNKHHNNYNRHGDHRGYHDYDRYDDHAYHHRPPKVVHRHRHRPWSHWQPHVVHTYHYHSFGAPVYYQAHPQYGAYYHVRARDRNNVALWLGISAITGAILFSSY